MVDFWAHRFLDDPKLRDEIVNPDFEGDLEELEASAADAAAESAVDASEWEEPVIETYGV